MLKILFKALAITVLVPFSVQAQLIGSPGTGGNCFPFTCDRGGTFYQQVYASSNFASPFSVTSFSFFSNGATLNSMTFDVFLSTSANPVNALNTSNPDANEGVDNALFGSFSLSGPSPAQLDFFGSAFSYDPSAGDLLVSLRNIDISSRGSGSFDARGGTAEGLFSRAHDFGSGFTNYGLVTEFNGRSVSVPEPGSILLLASGVLGMAVLRRRRGDANA